MGSGSAVFKSKEAALEAKKSYNGEILDGMKLIFELSGPSKQNKHIRQGDLRNKIKNGSSKHVEPKNGILSRLAPKIEDRLGKKVQSIEERLGKKYGKNGSDNARLAPVSTRAIKSYANLNVSELEGRLF